MKMLFFNGLKWFFILLINLSLSTLSEELFSLQFSMEEICKFYGCGTEIRRFIELFIYDHYDFVRAEYQEHMINKMIADFAAEEARRTTVLINFYNHLVKLTAKSSEVDTESTFKKQWNDVWTKNLKICVKKPTNKENAGDLEEAILRIWKADNDEEALSLWKQDQSFWSEKPEEVSGEDYLVISKLAKPTRTNLLLMNLNVETAVRNKDKDFAITLHEYGLKEKEKYRQCVWILTYGNNENKIERLKKEFNRIAPNPDFISQNHQFCQKLYAAWQATSIFNYPSWFLPGECKKPTDEDFEMFISTLLKDPENKDINVFVRIIKNFRSSGTLT